MQARHLENDLRRATTEYDNAVAERLRLQEQVRQHRVSVICHSNSRTKIAILLKKETKTIWKHNVTF